MTRMIGDLSARDLGTIIAVASKGFLYVGTLEAVEHSRNGRSSIRLKREDDGWQWFGFIESMDALQPVPPVCHPEIADEDSA